MSYTKRFSLLCAVSLVLLAVCSGELIARRNRETVLAEAKRYFAAAVLRLALQNFEESDFAVPQTGPARDAFRKKVSGILALPDIVAVYAFAPGGTLVWSDPPAPAGRKFEGDAALRRSLAGETVAVVAPPGFGEDAAGPLRAARRTLHLYVPVRFDRFARPAGVIVAERRIDLLDAQTSSTRLLVWAILGAGFCAFYGALIGMVRRGSRLIARKREELKASRAKVESQRMELLSRIGAAAMRETDLCCMLAEVARDVRRLLALPRVTIRVFGDPDTVVEETAFGIPSAAGAFPPRLRGGGCKALPLDERLAVEDSARFAPCEGDLARKWEEVRLGGLLSLPLLVPGEDPIGMLIIERSEVRRWTEDEIGAAEAVAHQVAIAVRHARVFAQQQELAGRLSSLINNVPGLVYRGMPDWTMPVVGTNAEAVIGYPAEAFTRHGKKWSDLIHPEDLPAVRERIREAVRRGERLLRLEYRVLHHDGRVLWVSDRRQMIYDGRGRLSCVDGLVLDITERKKMEQWRRLTQFAVDRAGDAAYWMDASGRLLYVNEQACRVLGYTREELLGMSIHDINPNFPPEVWPDHWAELQKRRSYTFESRHKAKDGRLIPVEVTVNYIEFDGKEYNCASARDITERKRAQEENRLLQQQLIQSQKMEALGIMAGGIAHDFNNLLTGILGYADLLGRRSVQDAAVEEAAAVIRLAAERAADLTAQLLGFARKGKHRAVPIDLHRLVEDAAVLLERTMGRHVVIEKRFKAGKEGTVGDEAQIHQVVMNLAVNAYEAMPGGGTLTFSTDVVEVDEAHRLCRSGVPPGRYVRLTVRDTGAGIPEENLGRIFDPFFTTKEQGRGTGLGLATVFGIVKNHNGHVEVESRPGEGTVFSVFLPALALPLEAGEAPPPKTPRERRKGKGRILVIDDQETVREVCTAMLTQLGYEVTTASDGREGLERFRRHFREIDLVIVDMVMPHMGGRECFREMKKVDPAVRAVLSTGYSLEGSVQETLEEGMAGFIQKPYRLERLAEVVAEALNGSGE